MRSVAAKDRLHIVAVWVEDEGCVVMRPALARWPIIGSTCLEGCGVKGIHLRSILRRECCMLANRMRVIAIYPEDRILDAIADAVRTNILRQLHYPVQSERGQRSVVEPR